jgi:hypothetical protein
MQSPSRVIDEAAGVFATSPYPDEADHPSNKLPEEAPKVEVSDDDFDEPLPPRQCSIDNPGCESCQ